jgi:hypothetical protein
MEGWAFHEAFGDIFAIINMLQYDMVLDAVLKETNGNLKQSNLLTKIAPQMGSSIYHVSGGRMGYPDCLRNAFNSFTYTPPEQLPHTNSYDKLAAEPHNFSRLFTGAWYDILCGIYEERKTKLSPKEALVAARDVLSVYTFGALPLASSGIRFYDAMARAIIVMDKANSYTYNDLLNQVFRSRNILGADFKPLVEMNWTMCRTMFEEPTDEIFRHKDIVAVRNSHTQHLPLPHYMLTVEMPNDSYYEFNGTGECVDSITQTGDELISHANHCVEFLHKNGMIRPDELTPFEITKDGKLIRSHFSGCFGDNSLNPQAPEFNKGYKLKNNAGCGCNCKKCNQTPATTKHGGNPAGKVVVNRCCTSSKNFRSCS